MVFLLSLFLLTHLPPRPPRWTRPPARHESSLWPRPDWTLTSTGPSPAGWMKSPRLPSKPPSSRTAARPTAGQESRSSPSGRWRTSRSNPLWGSWTAASPPINLKQRPRTENVYKEPLVYHRHFIAVLKTLFEADEEFQSTHRSHSKCHNLVLPYTNVYFLIFVFNLLWVCSMCISDDLLYSL